MVLPFKYFLLKSDVQVLLKISLLKILIHKRCSKLILQTTLKLSFVYNFDPKKLLKISFTNITQINSQALLKLTSNLTLN